MVRTTSRCDLALALCIAGMSTSVNTCLGSVIGSDSASDPVYADGWQGLNGAVPGETGEDNGGSGFSPWDFRTTYWDPLQSPYSQPHFIDTEPSPFNNLGAPAFAMTNANLPFFGFASVAIRAFANPLEVGQRFSVDLDNPVMDPLHMHDSAGFIVQLRTATNSEGVRFERFAFYASAGFNQDEWTITDGSGDATATGLTDVEGSEGFRLAFTLTSEESYSLTITPLGGKPASSFQGDLANPGTGKIVSIKFVIYGNGSGDGRMQPTGEREFYFNNLSVESVLEGLPFRRGDADGDGERDLGDALSIIFSLFIEGSPQPACLKSADSNDDGLFDLSDAVFALEFHFGQGAPFPQPSSNCGLDPTQDPLSCGQYLPCAPAEPPG